MLVPASGFRLGFDLEPISNIDSDFSSMPQRLNKNRTRVFAGKGNSFVRALRTCSRNVADPLCGEAKFVGEARGTSRPIAYVLDIRNDLIEFNLMN